MKIASYGKPRFIASINIATDQKKVIDVPAGNYAGFLLYAAGTNDTSDDYTFADNANNAILRLNNNDLVNLPMGFLADFTNLEHGATGNASATAGAFSQAAIIPCMAKGHLNSIHVRSNDVCLLTLDFGTIADIASGLCEVYALEADHPNVYMPRFYDIAVSIKAGKTKERIQSPNVIQLYGSTASTGLDNVQVEQDQRVIFNASDGAAIVLANIDNQVETALAYFNAVFADNSLQEGLGSKIEISLDGNTADTTTLYVFAFDSDLGRYRDSLAIVDAQLDRKALLSTQSGGEETVSVVKTVPSRSRMGFLRD